MADAVVNNPDRVGVEKVSTHLLEGVSKYHAQIGANVDQAHLRELSERLLAQAQQCVYAKQFEEALNTFLQVLALHEKLPASGHDGTRGIIVHNIGFCLHCLGELEAAKAYYLQSIDCLEKDRAAKPVTKKLLDSVLYPEQLVITALFGSTHENRIRMTKERLLDIEFGRKPDLTMMDGWGRKRVLPDLSGGRGVQEELSSKWEHEGPAAEEVAAPTPSWLAATQLIEPPRIAYDRVVRTDDDEESHEGTKDERRYASSSEEREEEARQQWLKYHLQACNWKEAAKLVVTSEERAELESLQQSVV